MASNKQSETILPQHAELIKASSITTAVAAARGYRSITIKAELKRLGFSDNQRIVPCLLVPVWSVHGEIGTYQIRPDTPRIGKNGKPIKYETPGGSRMVLDVPPMARAWLGDPHRRLMITEGVRKADAAVSHGLCCIDVLGVWNWRGRNRDGGSVALPDWELVALKGREVFIAYDGDVVIKIEVGAALRRLKEFLKSRGATVYVIRLPLGDGGSKVGLDDFLAAGHTVDDLFALASESIPTPAPDGNASAHPYRVEDNRICVEKDTRDGPVLVPLCNFDARIVEEVTLDDGDEQSRQFVISGRLDSRKPLPAVRVPTDRFSSMHWVTNAWGVVAVPAAGMGKKDQLREAIQRLSDNVTLRRIYTHTGWREIDGEFHYLTASGAVGRDDIEVELGKELASYQLPREPQDVVEAVRASLRLLDIAPATVTFPMWAAVFRAPLAAALPLNLYMWLDGFTGSLKSSLTAVFLSHWGGFDYKCLPESWESTANVLEKRAYTIKDAILVIDDYAPNSFDLMSYRSKATRLLRSQGNLSGRGRLRSDLTERRTYHPRGLILSTGEQRPTGQSVVARGFYLELDRSDVHLEKLTSAQSNTDILSHAMAGYVRWLAPQMKSIGTSFRESFESARRRAASVGTHLRHPELVAHLWVGVDCGLAYAEEIKAVDASEAADLRECAWEALVERAKAMGRMVEEEQPTRRFAEILAALIVQKRVELLPREDMRQGRNDVVGWRDAEYIYLIPDASFKAVCQFTREAGDPFPVGRRRLQQDLVREGIACPSSGRTTTTLRVQGHTQRVLRLRRAALSELIEQDFPDLGPFETAETGETGSEG